MSDDEDVCVLWWWLKGKRKRRKYWLHPLLADRTQSCYKIAKELDADEEKFQNFYREFHTIFQLSRSIFREIFSKSQNFEP